MGMCAVRTGLHAIVNGYVGNHAMEMSFGGYVLYFPFA